MNVIDLIQKEQEKPSVPEFRPGDTVKVYSKIVEGGKERIQMFEGICTVRKGGGSAETQRETIRKVLAHCSRPTDDALVDKIAGKVFSENSATFRKGAIGDWRNHFTDEQAARFAELAGPLLGKYGYDA